MPRLRKVQNSKYGGLRSGNSDDYETDLNYPIDSIDQNGIITKLKERNDFKNSKYAKVVFRLYLIAVLIINLILITIPYYRKKDNSIFSFFACLMLFIPMISVYSTVYTIENLNNDYLNLELFQETKILVLALILYLMAIIIKVIFYESNIQRDILYILPILISFCIIDINRENGHIKQSIKELESLKYDYKEA